MFKKERVSIREFSIKYHWQGQNSRVQTSNSQRYTPQCCCDDTLTTEVWYSPGRGNQAYVGIVCMAVSLSHPSLFQPSALLAHQFIVQCQGPVGEYNDIIGIIYPPYGELSDKQKDKKIENHKFTIHTYKSIFRGHSKQNCDVYSYKKRMSMVKIGGLYDSPRPFLKCWPWEMAKAIIKIFCEPSIFHRFLMFTFKHIF